MAFAFEPANEREPRCLTSKSFSEPAFIPFGRFDKTYEDMGADAVAAALRDAGVEWSQIQAAYLSRMYLPATSGARILRRLGSTDISIVDIEAACASGGAAMRQAVLGIRSGEIDLALVLGCEKMPRGFMDPAMLYSAWQIELGMSVNPAYWAIRAQRHMHDYGTTELQIAKVALKNHRNSVHNPYAMYRKEFSLEEILRSPLVCDPIRLLEICAPNDGAAAVVIASAAACSPTRLDGKDHQHRRHFPYHRPVFGGFPLSGGQHERTRR